MFVVQPSSHGNLKFVWFLESFRDWDLQVELQRLQKQSCRKWRNLANNTSKRSAELMLMDIIVTTNLLKITPKWCVQIFFWGIYTVHPWSHQINVLKWKHSSMSRCDVCTTSYIREHNQTTVLTDWKGGNRTYNTCRITNRIYIHIIKSFRLLIIFELSNSTNNSTIYNKPLKSNKNTFSNPQHFSMPISPGPCESSTADTAVSSFSASWELPCQDAVLGHSFWMWVAVWYMGVS